MLTSVTMKKKIQYSKLIPEKVKSTVGYKEKLGVEPIKSSTVKTPWPGTFPGKPTSDGLVVLARAVGPLS